MKKPGKSARSVASPLRADRRQKERQPELFRGEQKAEPDNDVEQTHQPDEHAQGRPHNDFSPNRPALQARSMCTV
jgi:hypothetical protein